MVACRKHFEGATAALLCSGDVTTDLATSGVDLVDLTRATDCLQIVKTIAEMDEM